MGSNVFIKSNSENHYYFNDRNNQMYLMPNDLENSIKKFFADELSTKNSNEQDYYTTKIDFWYSNGILNNVQRNELITSSFDFSVEQRLLNCQQIIFELTDSCNMNCVYCGQGELYKSDFKKNRFLNFSDCKPLIDFMLERWKRLPKWKRKIRRSITFYGGEPLLNFNTLKDIVEYIDSKHIDLNYVYTISTNGLLLDRHFHYLVEKNFQITVSLDGNSFHNTFRVDHSNKETFNQVSKNLELMKINYPEFFNQNIFFASVYNKNSTWNEVNHFFEKTFNKKSAISSLKDININESYEKEFNDLFKDVYDELPIEECSIIRGKRINQKKNSIDLIARNYTKYFQHSMIELLFDVKKIKIPTGTCLPFEKKIVLTSKKIIQHCEKFHNKFDLGTIDNEKVIIYQNLEDKYKKLLHWQVKWCGSCYYNLMCKKCFFLTEDSQEENKCEFYLNRSEFPIFLKDHISFLENSPSDNFYKQK